MTSKLVVAFLLLAGVIATVNSLHIPGFVNGKPLRVHLNKLWAPQAAASSGCATESNFTQIVDHFDLTNKSGTWNQRVQVNNKFFNTSVTDQPVIFLLIGGEGTADQQWVCWENYTYMTMAKSYNASVIQLEHRFFGYSYPIKTANGMGDMSPTALKLLTSQQALADLANFITTYNQQQKWTNPKWVVFGGSYPGSLCAWFRAQYPSLTVGGICSSAPLWAKVDFYEYAQVMEYAITNRSMSNDKNSKCPDQIKQAFALVRQMVYTDVGRQNLSAAFNITPPLNPSMTNTFESDATNFLSGVFNSFQGIVQYTFDARNNNTIHGYDIDQLCQRMTDPKKDLISRLADVFYWTSSVENDMPINGFDNNYTAEILVLNRTTFDLTNKDDRDGISAERGWMWLCCGMALGWLQTTDNSNGMFNRMIPLNYYLQMCTDMFGPDINTKYITDQVTIIGYIFPPPWNYTATNVVLPNGDYDPWSALGGYVNDTSRHQISILTHGAAHCNDMYPQRDNEPPAIKDTRKIIQDQVNYYLTSNTPLVTGTSPPGSTPTNTASMSTGNMPTNTAPTPTGSTTPNTAAARTMSSTTTFLSSFFFLIVAFIIFK